MCARACVGLMRVCACACVCVCVCVCVNRSDVKDNAAAMMPLSEIMDRLKVDSRLHQVGNLQKDVALFLSTLSSPLLSSHS